jgi:hypothetical protein
MYSRIFTIYLKSDNETNSWKVIIDVGVKNTVLQQKCKFARVSSIPESSFFLFHEAVFLVSLGRSSFLAWLKKSGLCGY